MYVCTVCMYVCITTDLYLAVMDASISLTVASVTYSKGNKTHTLPLLETIARSPSGNSFTSRLQQQSKIKCTFCIPNITDIKAVKLCGSVLFLRHDVNARKLTYEYFIIIVFNLLILW